MTHIVVLGSTNMDLVTYVEKAPQRGETVTGREFRTIPGGKGANQAIAAAHAGATVSVIGAVGTDAYGPRLRATLELPHPRLRSGGGTPMGVDTDLLRTIEGPSGTAHIVVDDEGGNAIVVIPGANGTVDHVGALATALGQERPIREALRWAAAAAALSVQRPGASASMPYRSEIEAQYTS
ncbi:PfkB family carbohydrate kinase [Streptomyces sp. NPDC002764]|uniref:PfkB family carbohydrate kinase n=1 Tax=Streptomyces sp. NPDC002764 TaxID=3154428 RepID=UPI00331CFCB5